MIAVSLALVWMLIYPLSSPEGGAREEVVVNKEQAHLQGYFLFLWPQMGKIRQCPRGDNEGKVRTVREFKPSYQSEGLNRKCDRGTGVQMRVAGGGSSATKREKQASR